MDYVCIDAVRAYNELELLLVKKARSPVPSHIGKLNFVGGKIEGEETPEQAALREFEEETGFSQDDVVHLSKKGCLIADDGDWIVYFFYFVLSSKVGNPINKDETEPVAWYDWKTVDKSILVPNVKPIVILNRFAPTWASLDSRMDNFN